MSRLLKIIIGILFVLSLTLFLLNKGKHVYLYSDIKVGEEIEFLSNGIKISGSLLKPEIAGELPAIIMVSGSGANSYRRGWKEENPGMWRVVSEHFINKGFAVLLLEKRGINKSNGHWESEDFYNRANDVYSAVKYLKNRKDILSDRIGLMGHSQGGWIVQLTAAQFPKDIAFIINLAGPSVTVKQQVIDDYTGVWRMKGLTEEEINKKSNTLRVGLDAFGIFSRILKTGQFSRIINYDPEDIIPKIQIPVFSIYGEKDYLVPPDTNSKKLIEGLKKGGNNNYEIQIVHNAEHAFNLLGEKEKFAPEFFDALERFNVWFNQYR